MKSQWKKICEQLPGFRSVLGQRPQAAGADALTGLLRRFTVEQQLVPRDLTELVAKNYLDAIPVPPDGQRYIIDRRRVEVRLE